jgi:rod shape-determining protein MreD
MSRFEPRVTNSVLLNLVPYVVLLAFVLLDGIPALSGFLVQFEFALFLVPVFFIGLHAESDFAILGILATGLLQDVLSGTPLGFWGILFCLLYVVAHAQRQILAHKPLSAHWANFLVFVCLVFALGYVIAALREDMIIAGGGYFLTAMATVLSFPLIYYPLLHMRSDDQGQMIGILNGRL